MARLTFNCLETIYINRSTSDQITVRSFFAHFDAAFKRNTVLIIISGICFVVALNNSKTNAHVSITFAFVSVE